MNSKDYINQLNTYIKNYETYDNQQYVNIILHTIDKLTTNNEVKDKFQNYRDIFDSFQKHINQSFPNISERIKEYILYVDDDFENKNRSPKVMLVCYKSNVVDICYYKLFVVRLTSFISSYFNIFCNNKFSFIKVNTNTFKNIFKNIDEELKLYKDIEFYYKNKNIIIDPFALSLKEMQENLLKQMDNTNEWIMKLNKNKISSICLF